MIEIYMDVRKIIPRMYHKQIREIYDIWFDIMWIAFRVLKNSKSTVIGVGLK